MKRKQQRFRVVKRAVGRAAIFYARKNSLVRQALSIEQRIAKTMATLPKASEATQLLEETNHRGIVYSQKVSRLRQRLSAARKRMIRQKEALSILLKQAELDKVELPRQKISEKELEQRIAQLESMIKQLNGIIKPTAIAQPDGIKPLFTITLTKRNH